MLRWLVLALVAANLVFWAWTQGWLDDVIGVGPDSDREPRRLARQVRPEAIRILGPAEVRVVAPAASAASVTPDEPAVVEPRPGADSSAPAATTSEACLEAGPFTPSELVAAEAALVRASLPLGSWVDVRVDKPGTWIVYLGRFPQRDQLEKTVEELRRLKIAFEELGKVPDLEPGLALGRYDTREAAETALAALSQRGVRSARVVVIAAPTTRHLLRIERADANLRTQVAALRSSALGAGFQRCGSGDAAAPGR